MPVVVCAGSVVLFDVVSIMAFAQNIMMITARTTTRKSIIKASMRSLLRLPFFLRLFWFLYSAGLVPLPEDFAFCVGFAPCAGLAPCAVGLAPAGRAPCAGLAPCAVGLAPAGRAPYAVLAPCAGFLLGLLGVLFNVEASFEKNTEYRL